MHRYILVILTMSLLLLAGCTTRDMAHVRNSIKAEGEFFEENGTAKYNYYSYANGGAPIAYLALDKKYTLQSEFWYETAMNAAIWADLSANASFRISDKYRGKEIVSQQSESIGFVLSRYYWVTAWFLEPGSMTIIIPPPERSPQQPDPNRLRRDR